MAKRSVALISALIAVGLVVVIYSVAFPIFTTSRSATTTTTSTSSGASTPLVPGLQLNLVLNASSVPPHGAIGARIELVNTMNQSLTLPVPAFSQTEQVEQWNQYDYVCGSNPADSIVVFAVFRGHYSAANLSSAGTPLQVGAPFLPPCPNGGNYPADNSITFSSKEVIEDLVATTGYCNGSGLSGHGGSVSCGLVGGLFGYWNRTTPSQGDLNFTSPAFTYFPPDEYTVAATDLWGQYAFATFTVGSQAGPSPIVVGASCFIPVSAGGQVGLFANSTFNGDNVTYANGTSILFSNYSCPRPVLEGSNQSPDIYAMAMAAVTNSSFIAAENGSQFILQQAGGLVCYTSGTQKCSLTFYFYHYGENGTLFQCGGGYDANLTQTLYRRDALDGLMVTFYTSGPDTNAQVNANIAWDLQNPVIQVMSPSQLVEIYDDSYPCG